LSLNLLERHEKQYSGGAHKAPYLYSFIKVWENLLVNVSFELMELKINSKLTLVIALQSVWRFFYL
jgi:hypothetical protein